MRAQALFAAAVALAAASASAVAQQGGVALVDAVPSITVEGFAKRELRPDLAVVTVGVTTDRPTAVEAAGDNAHAAAAIVSAAQAAGITGPDIQTSQFRLFALLDQHDASKTRAFRASNIVTLRIHDLDRVGSIVGQLVAQGANDIRDIDFELADPAPVLRQLGAEATQEARDKANAYAKAAGVTLGRVLRITPAAAAPVPLVRSFRMAAAAAPTPPVEAGAETVEAQVQVTWELVPSPSGTP